jgi:transmembrane sensor
MISGKQAIALTPAIDQSIVQEAARWMARLWSEHASEADHAACAQWRQQRAEHELAWQRLLIMEQKLLSIPDPAARKTLHTAAPKRAVNRRKALQMLGLLVAVGGAVQVVRRSDTWRLLSADYASAVGEIREIVLPDGTQVVLNTNSAIDIDFNGTQRRILLRAGEILVTTAKDTAPAHRPLSVHGRDGAVYALGTRFIVRQDAHQTDVAVLQGAVEICPALAPTLRLRLDAGQRADFSQRAIGTPGEIPENLASWSRGVLVAEQMPLADFLAAVGRYRSGMLRFAPELGDMKVSGVFSLRDTDRALLNLTLALPVQLSYRTRYWVTVLPL